MIKTTFRATVSDHDLKWIQNFKEEHNFSNNAQVVHYFMKLAQNENEILSQTEVLGDIKKQQQEINNQLKELCTGLNSIHEQSSLEFKEQIVLDELRKFDQEIHRTIRVIES
ncbi:MAG: hypothetical protein N4R16_04965 [Lactobacillus crispatus]|nr:hypothetical protein [Lactobacillus crispatus]